MYCKYCILTIMYMRATSLLLENSSTARIVQRTAPTAPPPPDFAQAFGLQPGYNPSDGGFHKWGLMGFTIGKP